MEFVEAPAFTRHLSSYLKDDDYKDLQTRLRVNPGLGDLMPGTGGLRKMRWADVRRGKGRRGGLRIIYVYFPSSHQIWLMTLYDKGEASDLTEKEKKTLKLAMDTELKMRAAKQASGARRLWRIN
jgi:hypothetical protein